MFQRIKIGTHQRGLLHHGQDYLRFLTPGVHWVWGFDRTVEVVSTQDQPEFEHDRLVEYLDDPRCWDDLIVANLSDDERALVWIDGRIHAVLGPGRAAFWKDLREVKLEPLTVRELQLQHTKLDAILAADHDGLLEEVRVPKGSRGLLYVDEVLQQELPPGRYAFWRGVARLRTEIVDLRETLVEVTGQEILTADKVSLRINLSASYKVRDLRLAAEGSVDYAASLYRVLQLALRESVGSRTLDALLGDKDAVGREVHTAVEPKARALGVTLGEAGIRDIILPGDMKLLLNQVIEAEKRAKANLIQRREETAATRSLLNTAKLIESSPTLLRLKELETAERIAANVESLNLVGGASGLEGVLGQLLPKRS